MDSLGVLYLAASNLAADMKDVAPDKHPCVTIP